MVGIVLYPTKYNIDNNYPGNGCPGLTRKNIQLTPKRPLQNPSGVVTAALPYSRTVSGGAPSQLDFATTSNTGADTDKFKQFECTSIGESVARNTADQRTLKPGIA
jgi:hypothetical protein